MPIFNPPPTCALKLVQIPVPIILMATTVKHKHATRHEEAWVLTTFLSACLPCVCNMSSVELVIGIKEL